MMRQWTALLLLLPFLASAQLQTAKIFASNMVLQRDKPVHIWGKGNPNTTVSITFLHDKKEVRIRADSSWSVFFSAQQASAVPASITITDNKDTIVLNNVLIGDVWLCSGQSNMEWALSKEMHYATEKEHLKQPLIRLYNPSPAGRYVYGVAYTDSLNQRLTTTDFYEGTWQNCDSNAAPAMSAVAYYFAKAIIAKVHIPVGLINLSIGGAPIETFISTTALQNSQRFQAKVKGNWLYNDSLPKWIRQRALENIGNNVNGFGDASGLNHAYKPGFAYESGIAPIVAMPIKGVIWYQGESNSLEERSVNEYKDLQKLLINDYRNKWQEPDLPFFWVQLSSVDTPYYQSQYWPQFRDAQRQLLNEVSNGGMAVCSDIGLTNSVHPTNKKVVGERLARWALHTTYGENIIPSGPLPLAANFENGQIVISFQYAGKGLQTSDGKLLRGFSVDGKNEISAFIRHKTVVINTSVQPQFIYYGWKPFTDANLVNSALLPASTFKIPVR